LDRIRERNSERGFEISLNPALPTPSNTVALVLLSEIEAATAAPSDQSNLSFTRSSDIKANADLRSILPSVWSGTPTTTASRTAG
jgi:hypothetical protein